MIPTWLRGLAETVKKKSLLGICTRLFLCCLSTQDGILVKMGNKDIFILGEETFTTAKRESAMSSRRKKHCVALIGDIVRSRTLDASRRYRVQQKLSMLLDELNKRYSSSLISSFVVTLGDEFQGLLKEPRIVPDLVWRLEDSLEGVQVRIGM